MGPSNFPRHRLAAMLAAVVLAAGLVVVTPSAASAAEQHCSMTVIGQKRSGEFMTTPVTCGASGGFTTLSSIAVHYTDLNFNGSTLSISGGACNGGWLNLPAGWDNVISSTWSVCTTQHYDGSNLSGSSESLSPTGGNLTTLQDRANSVRYT